MHVPQHLKDRVTAKLKGGIALAEARYNQKFAMPTVTYAKRGTTAGTADYNRWVINLNAVLLIENPDDFIDRTVLHELAHLITDRVYPENHRGRGITITRTGRVKRAKRDVHGPDWQSVCRVIGMTDVTRCHSYDTTNSKVVKSNGRQIAWKCSRCGAGLMLTPKMSAQLDASPHSRWHRGCKGWRLVRVNAVEAAPKPVLTPEVANNPAAVRLRDLLNSRLIVQDAPTLPAAPSMDGMSKIDKCKAIYQRNRHESRSMIIQMFVNAGCTQAGAGTYYATCKKLFG